MKKIMLILSAAVLLLCTTTCNSDEKNKGAFAKNIPKCLKQKIENSNWIWRADEYCSTHDTRKIYIYYYHPSETLTMMGYDEYCNFFMVEPEEGTPNPNDPNGFVWGFLLSDGTIEYEEDIYHFKRIVFTQK